MSLWTRDEIGRLAEVAEIRRIYTTVASQLLDVDKPCLVVTSSQRGEGKTSLVALLATLAARHTGKRVLAVDLNWHQAALHTCFGLVPESDLEALRRDVGALDSQVCSSGFDGLDLLTAPHARAREPRSGIGDLVVALTVLERARSRYDQIIVDTASLFPTNRYMIDPVAVSAAVDATLLVVLAGVTPKQAVKRALVGLDTAGANVIGTIVNQWQNPIKQTAG
jgi:Mrp family chromosome partitioning ATPase